MGDENPINQSDFIVRIGTFLMLLGTFFIILFLASDFAKQTDFDWLFLGVSFLLVGFLFRRKAPPPPPSDRFSGVRKWRANAEKRKQEKVDKRKANKK